MGDDLGCEDKPAASRMMQDLGVDYIVHHVGYDERRDPAVIAAHGGVPPSPLDELVAVVKAVSIPVQAVGGLSVEQVMQLPQIRSSSPGVGRAADGGCQLLQDALARPGRIVARDYCQVEQLREGIRARGRSETRRLKSMNAW